jgi:hypothetical protein
MYQESGQPGSAVPAFNSSAILPGAMDYSSNITSAEMLKAGEAQRAADQRGWLNITNLFKTEPICGGDLSLHKCSLHHAVVEYDVTLSSNGILSLRNKNWQDDKVLFQTYAFINNPLPYSPLTKLMQTILEPSYWVFRIFRHPIGALGPNRTLGLLVHGRVQRRDIHILQR